MLGDWLHLHAAWRDTDQRWYRLATMNGLDHKPFGGSFDPCHGVRYWQPPRMCKNTYIYKTHIYIYMRRHPHQTSIYNMARLDLILKDAGQIEVSKNQGPPNRESLATRTPSRRTHNFLKQPYGANSSWGSHTGRNRSQTLIYTMVHLVLEPNMCGDLAEPWPVVC